MHITFADKQTRDTCERTQTAARRFGRLAAAALQSLIADIDAASTLGDLPLDTVPDLDGHGYIKLGCGLIVIYTVQPRSNRDAIFEIRIDGIRE